MELNSDWPELGRKSISTEVVHKLPQQYIAELLMINENEQLAKKPNFWRDEEYKTRYMNRTLEARRHIETAGFRAVHNAIKKNKLTNLNTEEAQSEILTEILSS